VGKQNHEFHLHAALDVLRELLQEMEQAEREDQLARCPETNAGRTPGRKIEPSGLRTPPGSDRRIFECNMTIVWQELQPVF
jgi:hypothetical protein